MKITNIKTFLMHAGAPEPKAYATDAGLGTEQFSTGLTGTRNWLFVKVYTDIGIVGIGECSGWPRVIETAVQDLTRLLIGEDPIHIERLWQKMYSAIMGHGMTGTVGAGAITGIDMALWDIKGKALGVPVWNLLGGMVRDKIRIYGHAKTPEVALSLKARGITAIKCGGVSDPVRMVARLREAVGDDMDIMIDLHGPPWLTPADAAQVARALEPYRLLFIEDPIAPENLDGYRRIRDAAHVPLAAGERMVTIFGLRELIERDLVDVVQPDTGRAGGITQMKKIAAMAEAHHIMMAPHSGSLGPVAEYAALHLMAAIPNALILERIEDDWAGREHTVVPHPRSQDGFLKVPDTPGLGVDIDEAFVARFPSQANVSVQASEQSGSYAAGTHRESVYVQTRLQTAAYLAGTEREEGMKIDRLRVFMSRDKDRPRVIVAMDTDEGITGWGECYNHGPDKALFPLLDYLLHFLQGQDPRRIAFLVHYLKQQSRFPPGALGLAAISALDHCMWDISAKALNVPVYMLLGGNVRERVRVYAGLYSAPDPAIARDQMDALESRWGLTAFKLSPFRIDMHRHRWGEVVRTSAEYFRELRETVRADYEIAFDAHAKIFEPVQAIQLGNALAPYDPLFFEEPIRPENFEAWAELKRGLVCPLATGESLYNSFEFLRLLQVRGCDIVQPDICVVGGMLEMCRIAALAETHFVTIAPHNPMGPLATAINVHFCAAQTNFRILEYRLPHVAGNSTGKSSSEAATTGSAGPRYVKDPYLPVGGYLELRPDRAGWGVEMDEQLLGTEDYIHWQRKVPVKSDGATGYA